MATKNKWPASTATLISPSSTEARAAGASGPGWLARLLRRKTAIWILLVLPGLWPVWPLVLSRDPTVATDPGKYVLHHLGFTAAVLLALVLTFSPLRIFWPKSALVRALNRHRRLVGVSVFVYASLHLTMHFIYEGGFGTFATDWKKPFIAFGLGAFAILLVLAVTSINPFVRRLGGRRWKNLHRLVYLAAGLVVWHQILARKLFPPQVVWIFGPLILLEIARIWHARARRPKKTA